MWLALVSYMGARDSNLGPHACLAGLLPTKPSPQPPLLAVFSRYDLLYSPGWPETFVVQTYQAGLELEFTTSASGVLGFRVCLVIILRILSLLHGVLV